MKTVWVLAAAAALALAAYAWRGWYSRYTRDDYCSAVVTRDHDFAGAMAWHRQHWSGRYSYLAVKTSMERVGPWTPRIVPAVLLASWVGVAAWTLRRSRVSRGQAWALATMLVYAVFAVSPDVLNRGGPLMWETGSLTYALPLVIVTLWLGLFGLRGQLTFLCGASAVLLFVAGGFSETSLAAQGALAGGMAMVSAFRRERRPLAIAAAGVFGTLASLAVVLSAPGNAIRAADLPARQPLSIVALQMLEELHGYAFHHLLRHGAPLLFALIAGILMRASGSTKRVSAHSLGPAACLAIVASVVPSAWLLSARAPLRALHVTTFFAVLAVLALGTLCARRIPSPVMLLLAILPLWSAWTTIRTIPAAQAAAAEIDRIERSLRGGGDVVVRSPWALQTEFASQRATDWTNVCLCQYTGAKSLRVTP